MKHCVKLLIMPGWSQWSVSDPYSAYPSLAKSNECLSLDITEKTNQLAQIEAPTMVHRPSLSSLVSSISLQSHSSVDETPILDACMERSESSASSSSSNASESTSATSAVSSAGSCSIMDRKRPLVGQRAASSEHVIKLRASKSRLNLKKIGDAEVKTAVSTPLRTVLSRHESISSLRSYTASMSQYSPTTSEYNMLYLPMDNLPSPIHTTSSGDAMRRNYSSTSGSASVSMSTGRRSSLISQNLDTRKTLFEIWSAAEEADRTRKLKKKKPSPSPKRVYRTVYTGDFRSNTKKVKNWVGKLRKSTSVANLRMRDRNGDEDTWERFDNCFEPRMRLDLKRMGSIDDLLAPEEDMEGVEKCSKRTVSNHPVWDFLG